MKKLKLSGWDAATMQPFGDVPFVPYIHTHIEYPPGEYELPEMFIFEINMDPGNLLIWEGPITFVNGSGPFKTGEMYAPIFARAARLRCTGHVRIEGIKKDPMFLRALYTAYAITQIRRSR